MHEILKTAIPEPLISRLRPLYGALRLRWYRLVGRAYSPGETSKARQRREREGFCERYCRGSGLDIGYGGDPVTSGCRGWDVEHGDATKLEGLADAAFDYVYSSHALEHIPDHETALRSWWRVLKPGGFLILYLPHRDLYEKKRNLPSRWNPTHLRFFLPDQDDPPDTKGLLPLLRRVLPDHELVQSKVCDEGHTITDPEIHSDGEYSIEVVIRKSPTS